MSWQHVCVLDRSSTRFKSKSLNLIIVCPLEYERCNYIPLSSSYARFPEKLRYTSEWNLYWWADVYSDLSGLCVSADTNTDGKTWNAVRPTIPKNHNLWIEWNLLIVVLNLNLYIQSAMRHSWGKAARPSYVFEWQKCHIASHLCLPTGNGTLQNEL